MHHHGLVGLPVRADVLQIEPPRQVEVELDGGKLPRAPDRVHHLDIDLRAVEGRLVRHHLGLDVPLAQRFEEAVLCQLPFVGRTRVLRASPAVPSRQLDSEVGEPEHPQHFHGKVDTADHLGFDLIRSAEDVRVVLGEPAHAQQAVHDA